MILEKQADYLFHIFFILVIGMILAENWHKKQSLSIILVICAFIGMILFCMLSNYQ